MSSQIPIVSSHQPCGDVTFSSVNQILKSYREYMSDMQQSSDVENLFWSKPKILHEWPQI